MDAIVQPVSTPQPHHSLDLHSIVADAPPSYMRGRTHIRDLVARLLGCSILEAEYRVDRLERTGAIYFERERSPSLPDRGRWRARGPL